MINYNILQRLSRDGKLALSIALDDMIEELEMNSRCEFAGSTKINSEYHLKIGRDIAYLTRLMQELDKELGIKEEADAQN